MNQEETVPAVLRPLQMHEQAPTPEQHNGGKRWLFGLALLLLLFLLLNR